jgi:hypothetical protein
MREPRRLSHAYNSLQLRLISRWLHATPNYGTGRQPRGSLVTDQALPKKVCRRQECSNKAACSYQVATGRLTRRSASPPMTQRTAEYGPGFWKNVMRSLSHILWRASQEDAGSLCLSASPSHRHHCLHIYSWWWLR